MMVEVFTFVGGLVLKVCGDFFDENESVRVIRERILVNDDDEDHLEVFFEDIVMNRSKRVNEMNDRE